MSQQEQQRPRYRILAIVMNAVGHINACQGLCDKLRDHGHDVVFLIDEEFAGRLKPFGFEECHYRMPKPTIENESGEKIEFWQWFLSHNAKLYSLSPVEQMEQLNPTVFRTMFDQQRSVEDIYRKSIEDIRPDLIISDCYISCPAIIMSGIPWIWLFSAAPQAMIMDPRLPPFYSGLPSNGDKKQWQEFQQRTNKAYESLFNDINEYSMEKGMQPLNNRLHPLSPYLNIYMWPLEMRYQEMNELPENIFGVDNLMRKTAQQQFDIPESIRNKPGKLILFSMGSFGCSNVGLMKRLVGIFSKSPNRFIVSKGPMEYDLSENMWGDKFLPQKAILPLVDLVITHGGNNTVTESFYFGKKMLILPTFDDQFDNAQRLVEVGLGARLNPFESSEKEFLDTIQRLLDDEQLTERMAKIGERIRGSENDKEKLAKRVEEICEKYQNQKKKINQKNN
ncbi:NDP-glycosyltransferase YjiC [Dermatophagoides farinae]|uniref:NDP-glycosyltransferase YjiC n=1 Tax=Dermatophagoides farinae TaxID=6954 RepID=UPI003F617A1C